jgi:hypothetical protein
MEGLELRFIDGTVDRAPVHVAVARRLAHHELVVRRAPRVLTGPAHQRAVRGQRGLTAAQRLLVENRRAQVPVDATRSDDSEGLESVRPLNLNGHSASLVG